MWRKVRGPFLIGCRRGQRWRDARFMQLRRMVHELSSTSVHVSLNLQPKCMYLSKGTCISVIELIKTSVPKCSKNSDWHLAVSRENKLCVTNKCLFGFRWTVTPLLIGLFSTTFEGPFHFLRKISSCGAKSTHLKVQMIHSYQLLK